MEDEQMAGMGMAGGGSKRIYSDDDKASKFKAPADGEEDEDEDGEKIDLEAEDYEAAEEAELTPEEKK